MAVARGATMTDLPDTSRRHGSLSRLRYETSWLKLRGADGAPWGGRVGVGKGGDTKESVYTNRLYSHCFKYLNFILQDFSSIFNMLYKFKRNWSSKIYEIF